jgi:hypothetical protein
MANRNPWQARMKRWQKRWPVPIEELQAQAYGVLMMAYENVMVDDPEARRKHILAYFQGLTAFARLRETIALEDFDRRLTALEQQTPETNHHGTYP